MNALGITTGDAATKEVKGAGVKSSEREGIDEVFRAQIEDAVGQLTSRAGDWELE